MLLYVTEHSVITFFHLLRFSHALGNASRKLKFAETLCVCQLQEHSPYFALLSG